MTFVCCSALNVLFHNDFFGGFLVFEFVRNPLPQSCSALFQMDANQTILISKPWNIEPWLWYLAKPCIAQKVFKIMLGPPSPIDLALKRVHFWETLDSAADFMFKQESQRWRCRWVQGLCAHVCLRAPVDHLCAATTLSPPVFPVCVRPGSYVIAAGPLNGLAYRSRAGCLSVCISVIYR